MKFKVFRFDNGDYLNDYTVDDEGGIWFNTNSNVLAAIHLDLETESLDWLKYLNGEQIAVEVKVGK